MRKNLLALFLVFTFIAPFSAFGQTATKKTSPAMKAAQEITAKQLSDYLYFVASDAMEGRDTPSRGLDTTAEFLKMNLSRWGFKPAGDNGTFFQKISLRRESLDASATKLIVENSEFVLNEDYFRLSGNAATGNAPLVFGGDGWMVKAKNIDALSGVDVKGKIVVVAGNRPDFSQQFMIPPPVGVTQADLKGTRGTDWADPIGNAQEKGAAGVIVIAPAQLLGFWEQAKQFLGRGMMYPDKLRADNIQAPNPMPVMLASPKISNALYGATAPTSAGNLNKTGSLSAKTKTEMLMTQNVVAIWEGSDNLLKNEYVAVGAHYDHVGMNPNARGEDKIWNGADDDGSGTVAVLSIAEALAKSKIKPKRSILFVWHAGEEKGLWGSEYFTKFPTVDLSKVVTQLNIDMIGRSKKDGDTNPRNKELSGPNEIYVIGSKMMSTQLGEVTTNVNNSYLKLNYNYKYDDPNDPNRFFFRSDHFNYAQKGIPIVFWFDGEHEDYHGAGDHPDKIDYAKMEKVTRTIFLTMWEIADSKTRPAVDKQLPKELTER